MNRDQYSFAELAGLIQSLPSKHRQKIVAIDGLGGSGKKTFAMRLHRAMPHSAIIHASDFLKVESERVSGADFSVSPNFDWDRLEREVFTPLRFGEPVYYHKYDSFQDALGEKTHVAEDAVILLEGEYVAQNRFAENYDYKIWIEVPDSVRMTRILESDGEKKWKEWQDSVRPIEQHYLDTEKQQLRADLVINGNTADFEEGYYGILKL